MGSMPEHHSPVFPLSTRGPPQSPQPASQVLQCVSCKDIGPHAWVLRLKGTEAWDLNSEEAW